MTVRRDGTSDWDEERFLGGCWECSAELWLHWTHALKMVKLADFVLHVSYYKTKPNQNTKPSKTCSPRLHLPCESSSPDEPSSLHLGSCLGPTSTLRQQVQGTLVSLGALRTLGLEKDLGQSLRMTCFSLKE